MDANVLQNKKLEKISGRLQIISKKFQKNVTDATDNTTHHVFGKVNREKLPECILTVSVNGGMSITMKRAIDLVITHDSIVKQSTSGQAQIFATKNLTQKNSYISPFFTIKNPKFISIFILIFTYFLPFLIQFSFLYFPTFYHFFSPKQFFYIKSDLKILTQFLYSPHFYHPLSPKDNLPQESNLSLKNPIAIKIAKIGKIAKKP